jgi:hypothetical protein
MKSPGSYYNPSIKYTDATRDAWRGRPLFSQPSFAYPAEIDGKPRVFHVEMLRPRRRHKRCGWSSRVKVNGAVFSLAVITPTGSEESFVDVMFEGADPGVFYIEAHPSVAEFFLRLDMAARAGDERAVGAVAAVQVGIFLRRAWDCGERAGG